MNTLSVYLVWELARIFLTIECIKFVVQNTHTKRPPHSMLDITHSCAPPYRAAVVQFVER